jgi:hypothetical protein
MSVTQKGPARAAHLDVLGRCAGDQVGDEHPRLAAAAEDADRLARTRLLILHLCVCRPRCARLASRCLLLPLLLLRSPTEQVEARVHQVLAAASTAAAATAAATTAVAGGDLGLGSRRAAVHLQPEGEVAALDLLAKEIVAPLARRLGVGGRVLETRLLATGRDVRQ